MEKIAQYQGINIFQISVSGYFQAYIIDRFYIADTITGIKYFINVRIK